jgi:Bacterial Ig-like domain/Alpha-2-macroglobulin bait region domain
MHQGLLTPGLRRRNVLAVVAGVLVIAVGSGVGVYLDSRAHPPLQQPAKRAANGTAPTPAPVGAQSATQPQQDVFLKVVGTTPANGASQIPTNTSISILFNLAVNPVALNDLLAVQESRLEGESVPGTIAPGKKPQEVVFKPDTAFDGGSSVSVTLGSGVRSVVGATLAADYSFNFATVPDPDSVTFIYGNNFARLVSAPSGRSVTLNIQNGNSVPLNIGIKTYKATAKDLLAALVYSRSSDGYTTYADRDINTSSMRIVDNGGTTLTASGARTTKVESGVDLTISQPDGIYLILAADSKAQYGFVWIDFSRFGVLLRQDDQKLVIAGEDLTSAAATPRFSVTFYDLLNGVHPGVAGSFSGVAQFAATYPTRVDIAIASSAGEEIAVPISAPDSGAVIRVADLSHEPQIFLTTDKPAYLKGETVKFAGVVRISNDQIYTTGSGAKVVVWAGSVTASATVTAKGTFSGSFRMPADAFTADGLDNPLFLYASSTSTTSFLNGLQTFTRIVAIAPNSTTNVLTVSLDKSSYLAGEQLVASITGSSATRQPLAGATVSVLLYASQHGVQPAELDSFPSPSTWGEAIAGTVKVRLDSAGHATYRVTPKVGLKATDQEVTLVAVYGKGRTQSYAASTAIFYQADDEVFLLPGRSSFQQGDAVVATFVVESRGGARVPGLQLAYELASTDYTGDSAITRVVASGTVMTDANGVGAIRAAYKGEPSDLTMTIKGKDPAGRVFQTAEGLFVFPVGDGAPRLDMTTDKIAYTVGDTAKLLVASPLAANALLSLERGRVHEYRWIQLAKGDNAFTFNVSPDLAPGFDAVVSYIQNGEYSSEELPIFINNTNRLLKVTVTADQATYTKGQIAHVNIAVADNGDVPTAATLLADGYESRMTANLLQDRGSIAAAFLTPNRIGTNASSSLVGIGAIEGACGVDYGWPGSGWASGMYPGRSNVWLVGVSTDATGHASIDVPMNLPGPVRLVVVASTPTSSWGQAEAVINVG